MDYLKIDGHDEAIIGPACIWRDRTMVHVLVYDAEIIRKTLMKDGMTGEEAREYIEFNIEGAYVGEQTPVLVWRDDYYVA
jgi:DNA-binding transcriptional regulator of glucitol operon